MASNAPSLTPRSPELPDFTKTIEVPSLNFEAGRPMSRPLPLSPAQIAAMQQSLDRQKNWALMTPAEILGVPTPEKILGIPERDATGAQKNQTVMERYLERSNARQAGATNGAAVYNSSPEWNVPGREQARSNPEFSGSKNNDNPSAMNSFFGQTPDNRSTDANQNFSTPWQKPFASPAVVPVQTPEQLATAEEFQKLLQPHSSQASIAPAGFNSSLKTPPDTFLTQPPANPSGASFTPLSSGVGMPAGVQPLPGLFGGKNPSTTPVTPEWKPKLPPWMSSTPQSGTMPQRQF